MERWTDIRVYDTLFLFNDTDILFLMVLNDDGSVLGLGDKKSRTFHLLDTFRVGMAGEAMRTAAISTAIHRGNSKSVPLVRLDVKRLAQSLIQRSVLMENREIVGEGAEKLGTGQAWC